jgi:hypothetical protein
MSNHDQVAAAALPRFVRSAELRKLLGGINRDTLNELIKRGVIPPPLELSCRLKLYEYGAVVEAVRSRARKVAA